MFVGVFAGAMLGIGRGGSILALLFNLPMLIFALSAASTAYKFLR